MSYRTLLDNLDATSVTLPYVAEVLLDEMWYPYFVELSVDAVNGTDPAYHWVLEATRDGGATWYTLYTNNASAEETVTDFVNGFRWTLTEMTGMTTFTVSIYVGGK